MDHVLWFPGTPQPRSRASLVYSFTFFFFLVWDILPVQSDWSLSCDHGLDILRVNVTATTTASLHRNPTAPHRTAPHRTAPHRTAPHRTAPCFRLSRPTTVRGTGQRRMCRGRCQQRTSPSTWRPRGRSTGRRRVSTSATRRRRR